MTKKNHYLVQQDLIDHAKNPHNYGPLQDADFVKNEHNPLCGDSVVMFGKVQEDILQDTSFEGQGCMLSMAMASKLTERVKGMRLDEIMLLSNDLVEQLLGLELGPNRMQCGMLSIIALQQGVQEYQNS